MMRQPSIPIHLLEHFFSRAVTARTSCAQLRLSQKGGVFRAVVPDAEAMFQEYTKGQYPYDDMREVMYGAQDYDEGFHSNLFTPDYLLKLLTKADFRNIKIPTKAR
jgi:hypothetical protein